MRWAVCGVVAACARGAAVEPAEDTAAGGDVAPPSGALVLAGGGSEGEEGDAAAWSARLYPHLWDAGDVTGDGRVVVAVLSTAEETAWLPNYLVGLGADEAFNLEIGTREAASDAALGGVFAGVDAAFIKGGDQGAYRDLWDGTEVEAGLRALFLERGGGIGGTSAGAMSLAGFAFAGGQDLVTADVLEDARTPLLDDRDGGSGVHADFLPFLEGYVVDTHFTQRARLGRLAGILARVASDHAPASLAGLGCEEQTGVWIRDGVATVVGVGAVSLLRPSPEEAPQRPAGAPLTWAGLRLDRLTEGWRFDVATGAVDTTAPPAGAEAVAWDGRGTPASDPWYADGDLPRHERRFAWVQARGPQGWAEVPGDDPPLLADAVGVMDAFDVDRRAAAEEALFRGLYEHVGATGFLVGRGGSAQRVEGAPDVVALVDNPAADGPPMASLVVDTSAVTWRSLSPWPSLSDAGDGSLRAAGLVGAKLHVLYTPASGWGWDTVARQVVTLR